MTTIASVSTLPPPAFPSSTPAVPTASTPADTTPNDDNTPPTPIAAKPDAANNQVYNAVALASSSTIRGTSVNTSA